MVLHHAVDAL